MDLTFALMQPFREPHGRVRRRERERERDEKRIEEGGELPTSGLGVSLLLPRSPFI
jgi:hypothetical protein